MKIDTKKRLVVRLGSTDMRKGFDALADIVLEDRPDLLGVKGIYFIFCGKQRRTLKILYRDFDGDWTIWAKRVDVDATIDWPVDDDDLTVDLVKKLRKFLGSSKNFEKTEYYDPEIIKRKKMEAEFRKMKKKEKQQTKRKAAPTSTTKSRPRPQASI